MNKVLKSIICLVLCVCMVFPMVGYASAASSVGRVSNLTYSNTGDYKIDLSWSAVSGAKYYKVYKYNTSKESWSKIKTTTNNSYEVTGLGTAKTYQFKVRAYKSSKKYGSYSAVLNALTAPGQVTGVTFSSVTTNGFKISWTGVKRASGYQVYKYDDASNSWKLVKTTTSAAYTPTAGKLVPGTEYQYKVRAYYQNGSAKKYGRYSEVVSQMVKPSAPVGMQVAEVTNAGYTLSWKPVNGADKYVIYINNNGEWVKFDTVEKVCAFDIADTTGVVKTYCVRAVAESSNGAVYSNYSNAVSAVAKNDFENPDLPAAPTDVQLVSNPSKACINISWEPAEGVDGYQVYSYDAAKGQWNKVKTTASTACTYTAEATSIYYFKVRSYIIKDGTYYYSEFTDTEEVEFISEGKTPNDTIAAIEKNGIIGYLYDFEGQYFYTASDPWQRNFGFSPIYDVGAQFATMIYTTKRFYFSWNNLDWMIQVWKGDYGIVIGAEVGVYTKVPGSGVAGFYECAEDENCLNMSMVVKLDDTKIIDRSYGSYWWCTGFILQNPLNPYLQPWETWLQGSVCTDRMTMIARITLKDEKMRDGFRAALEKENVPYVYSGNDVIFTWQ